MTQLSSALYKLVNSRLATKRKPWNPEDSVRILCDSPWKKGDELFDWYSHRTDSIIETMQLRKEHESPFFHEYVTFSLRDNAGCFRVDRHQGPNETQPLAAVYNGGVQAYDTINSIRSLDDRHYGRSDCLIEITFRDDASVPLLLLLKICRTIAQHQSARIYTVQRYSCTFYSQAIILCTLQQVFVETVQSHARGLIHSEIAIDSDVLNQEFGRSMPPTGLPNLSHQNYPAIDFVTREDECSACWKSVLVRRTVGGSNDVFSLENLSGLFWDGVVRVAEHFIQLLDVTTGSRDGSWFLCPRFYLVELCQQLTYQAVHDTWDARLRLFERNFAGHGEATPRCTCSCREPGVSSGIETTTVEHSAHDALVFTENICSPGQVGLKTRNPEIAKFFRTNINDVQQEFRNKIFQTCQKNEILRDMLSTYYQAINRRVAIQVNLRHFGQRHLGHLVSQITSQMMHPGLLSNAIDQLMKGARAKSFDLLQESRVAILHLYMLLLLHAHGGRVDIYRIWLRYDAIDVVQDITQTIKEVWKLLNEKQG